jgi:hypothetical protein
MRGLMISAFAAVALLTTVTILLLSHTASADRPVGSAGVMSLQELHSAVDVNKLPIEEFEDQSLVYSRTKRSHFDADRNEPHRNKTHKGEM